jgi:hypothetical protein
MAIPQANALSYAVPLVILVPLLYRRLTRMLKPQPLKLNRLWIRPAIILLAGISVLVSAPPPLTDVPWFVVAAGAGAALGWQWGRLMAIHVDPENGTLMTRGSLAALIVIVLLILVRVGLRALLTMQGAAWHLDAVLITDGLIVFSAFLFGVRGLEMYLRARRVMAASLPG